MLINLDKALRSFKKWAKENPENTVGYKYDYYSGVGIKNMDAWMEKHYSKWTEEQRATYLLISWQRSLTAPTSPNGKRYPDGTDFFLKHYTGLFFNDPTKKSISLGISENDFQSCPFLVVETTENSWKGKITKYHIPIASSYTSEWRTFNDAKGVFEAGESWYLQRRKKAFLRDFQKIVQENADILLESKGPVIDPKFMEAALNFQQEQLELLPDISKLERVLKELREDIDESGISKRKINEVQGILNDLNYSLKHIKEHSPVIGKTKEESLKIFDKALQGGIPRLLRTDKRKKKVQE